MKRRDNVYEICDELYETSSWNGYTGKGRENESDVLMFNSMTNNLE